MTKISYALREDPSSIFMLEDAGKVYKNYCQTTMFARNIIRADFFNQYLYLFPFFGKNGKYQGKATDLKMSLEDNEREPEYCYVAVIESEVEFRVTPSVIKQLSKEHMPVWGVKSYLDYFTDRQCGFLLFLRIYKVNQPLDMVYVEKGSKGSVPIVQLYDELENLTSLNVDGMTPVISDNKFSYIRDEIIHMLKVENSFIAQYDNTPDGLKSLVERFEADKLIRGTHSKWELRHMQWLEDGFDVDASDDFDMAQLDYEVIYKQAVEASPGMESIIDYIRTIRAARLGEYEYLLKDVHVPNDRTAEAKNRLFEMSVRAAVKAALYHSERYGMEFDDSFQIACMGILFAIEKHSDSVEGLFPSYVSTWMTQRLNRDSTLYTNNYRLPVHFWDFLHQTLKTVMVKEEADFDQYTHKELQQVITNNTDCDAENAWRIAHATIPFESIEAIVEAGDIASDEDFVEDILKSVHMEEVRKTLEVLSEREKEIILHRFGFGDFPEATLEEVGQMYSVTRERVRQIEKKAKIKIARKLYKEKLVSEADYNQAMASLDPPSQKKKADE